MTAALEGGEWSAARPGRNLLPRKTRYPFYRRLGGPQGQSGREKSLSTPRPHFTLGKDPVLILQEAGWASELVLTGGKSRPHRDSIPDRLARSQSLYQLSYRA